MAPTLGLGSHLSRNRPMVPGVLQKGKHGRLHPSPNPNLYGDRDMIDGVVITPLRQIADERGKVMHMLRADSPVFKEFGEIYFSVVEPGAIKAWHIHTRMTLNYAVPVGKIKF